MPKDKNTFKFKTFDQLLQKEIQFKKTPKLRIQDESYLKECFEKWNTLNASLEFVELRNILGPKIMTLELLLHNIEDVIELLFKYIENGTSLSVYTVLDLLQSLVCDIREDIMPYMTRIFTIINKLVNTLNNDAESADLIFNAFSCIGHIIFYLEKSLIRDGKITELLPLIKPLLFHPKKPFVRRFMAQAFAFLLRKIKDFHTFFIDIILDQFVNEYTSNHADAIGKLMSFCLKTDDKLLSSAGPMFTSYFDVLYSRDKDVEFLVACFDEMFKDLLASINEDGYKKLWQLMVDKISNQSGDQPQELELLTIELFFKNAQNKKLLLCSKIFVTRVKALVNECASDKVVEIATLLIDKLPNCQEITDLMRAIILAKGMGMTKKFEFIKSYIMNEQFELTIRNSVSDYLTLYVTDEWLNESTDNLQTVLHCMSDLINVKYPISKRSSWKEQLASNGVNFNFFFLKNDPSPLIEAMIKIVKCENESKELLWMTLITIPHVYPANTYAVFVSELKRIIDSLFATDLDIGSLVDTSCILECVALLNDIQGTNTQITINTSNLLSILPQHTFTSSVEPIILEILSKSIAIDTEDKRHHDYENLFINKLMSPSHQSRLSAIEILMSMHYGDILIYCRQIEELLELSETEIVKKEKSIFRIMDHLRFTINMTDVSKKIIVSYLLGTLHVNYTSLWKYIMKTLCSFYPINKDEKKYSKQITDSNEVIIWSAVSSQLEFCANYLSLMTKNESLSSEYCCPQQEKYIMDKFYTGRNVDWLTYRLNLIKTMIKFPELSGRKTSVLSPLLLSVYCNEVRGHKENMRIRNDTLMSLMYLYSKIPNITCTHSESKCRRMFYKCLASKKPELQKAAFLVILNYKMPEIGGYKERIMLLLEKANDDDKNKLSEISLSEIIPSHRKVVVPIMLRIFLGKLKKAKSKKQKPLIGHLLQLERSEMSQLMLLLMEVLRQSDNEYDVVDENETIESISGSVKELVRSNNIPYGLLNTIQGVSGTIQAIVVGLVNKMSQEVLSSILMVVLDMYDCCTIIKQRKEEAMDTDDDENNQENFNVVKQIRQQCAAIVLFYFTKIEDYVWTDRDLSRVTESIVRPQSERLVDENVTSANTTILLSVLWSSSDRWMHLITDHLFTSYVTLLTKSKLDRVSVGHKLVNIVYNVMDRINIDARCKSMVVANLGTLISYLGKRVTAMRPYYKSKLSNEDQQVLYKELKMVTVCVDLLVEAQWTDEHAATIRDMINNVLVLLYKSNPYVNFVVTKTERATDFDNDANKEALEVSFLRAVETMMCASGGHESVIPYLERLLTLLGRLRRRASRSVLSVALGRILSLVAVPDYGDGIDLGQVLRNLNQWDENHLEDMDYDVIMASLTAVSHSLHSHPIDIALTTTNMHPTASIHPALWLYHATAQNCLYLITQVNEMGPRDAASRFLRQFIQSLAASGNDKIIRVLFFDHMWPFIVSILSTRDEMCHLAFVALLQTVLVSLGQQPRFTDITKLAQNEIDEKGFFDGILSMSDMEQTKGLRKLVKFLRLHQVSEMNLREIVRPIVMFRLTKMDVQSHTNRQRTEIKTLKNEYSNACMEAMTALAKQSPPAMYKKLIAEQMGKLDKGKEVEVSISVLVSVLEGYHNEADKVDDDMVTVLRNLEVHLARKDPSADRHKKAQKGGDQQSDLLNKKDAEWTLRGVCLQVPIARAMVNIAVKLPRKQMKEQVTRVLLRLCGFMKSNDLSVRKTSIDTMIEIMLTLNNNDQHTGGDVRFLNFAVNTIRSQMSRGFQRHVGLFACHNLLLRLAERGVLGRVTIEYGTMVTMTEMYLDEQFGEMAKEKAERHDAEKGMVREAATDKAYDGVRTLASVISKDQLVDFVRRLMDAAKEMRTQKNLNKMKTIVNSMQGGLVVNKRLEAQALFTVAMVHMAENLDSLFTKTREAAVFTGNTNGKKRDLNLYQPAVRLDGYSGTSDVSQKISMTDNYTFLVVNFGLTLFNTLVKAHKTVSATSIDLATVMDPVVDRVIAILTNLTHKDTLTAAIKTLKDMVEINPPRLSVRVKDVATLLFKLHDKNSFFRDKTDTASVAFYKTMTNFLRRNDVAVTETQYKVLLLGIELDSDQKRQMNSIYLLKEIINRRIKEPISSQQQVILLRQEVDVQLVDIITKIRPLSLSALTDRTRQEARNAIICFLRHYKSHDMDYIVDTLLYFAKNLIGSSHDNGPLSACLCIQDIIRSYPSVMTYDSKTKIYLTVLACMAVAMRRGVSCKLEEAMARICGQMMAALSEHDRDAVCEFLMTRVEAGGVSQDVGICVLLMNFVVPVIGERRTVWSRKLVESVCEKMPKMVEYGETLANQIRAVSGEDADLMATIVEESTMTKEQLMDEKNAVMGNIGRLLTMVGQMLDIDHEDMDAVAVKRHLIVSGQETSMWTSIISKLVTGGRNYPMTVRLSAAKNVVQTLLRYEVDYESERSERVFSSKQNVYMIIGALFGAMDNEDMVTEECDVILVNLLYTWRIVLASTTDDWRVRALRKILDKANRLANNELDTNTSVMRRCAMMKLLAGVIARTSVEDLGSMELSRNIVWMWMREDRQVRTGGKGKKRLEELPAKDVAEWAELIATLGKLIEATLGDTFHTLKLSLNTERETNKRKRKIESAALFVSDPCQAINKEKRRKTRK